MLRISDLCEALEAYQEPEQVAEVYRAYLFGAEAHEGQRRRSGEPYIHHPLEVAKILADMRLDYKSIVAAILHDVIEDTPFVKDQIAQEFGEEVAELVDGVSKLTQVQFESRAEAQAENFRKMMLAMAKDIRVILIKLADRLHNMRTMSAMPPDKRRRIARETLEIFAPIANRLGINSVRLELEDLGFANLYPLRYRVLSESMKKVRGNRKEIVGQIQTAISGRLQQHDVEASALGREKHLYSIYKKMVEKHLSFSEVFDVYAFRITVASVDDCYRVLGVVHNLYKPVPGKFKDYIAIPKANGYQSLHTILFGPYGVPIEVQIRTEDMHKVAEIGIAAHWAYKAGDSSSGAASQAREWLRNLLEMQQSAGNSLEFLESVKIDLFPDEVYVFTPKGNILTLPRGATAVDFAYAVHTDVGNACVSAKIDRRITPLRTQLLNGQTVEIITAPGARPNPLWLDFVITAKARSAIRHFLKNLRHDEAIVLGKRLLNRVLAGMSTNIEQIDQKRLLALLDEFHLDSLDSLFAEIGLGSRMATLVARHLVPATEGAGVEPSPQTLTPQPQGPLTIKGTEGLVVTFARCCKPIPGDPILGFITAGRGIVIHNESCKNVAEFRDKPEKWVDVQWEKDVTGVFPVDIRVDVANRPGVLATVAAAIAEAGANIENVSILERDGQFTAITFTISVHNRKHLANIMRRVKSVESVVKINRTRS